MLGNDLLTVIWAVPKTVSVAADRLRAEALTVCDEGLGVIQCALGKNVTLALMTATGESHVVRGDTQTSFEVQDAVSLTRLSTAVSPSTAPKPVFVPELKTVPEQPAARSDAHCALDDSTHFNSVDADLAPSFEAVPHGTEAYEATFPRPEVKLGQSCMRNPDAQVGSEIPDDSTVFFAPVESETFAQRPPVLQWPVAATLITISDTRGSLSYPLTDSLFVGRAPMAPADASADAQALAVVSSPSGSVSATHVRIRRQGDQVLVRDMWSTNGTTVVAPSTPPYRLGTGEELPVVPGTRLDLGDSVQVTIGGTSAP